METTAIAAYADALGKIVTDGVRTTAATILVTESEHAAVALGDLGRPQVPEPFVTGPPPSGRTRHEDHATAGDRGRRGPFGRAAGAGAVALGRGATTSRSAPRPRSPPP